VNDANNAWASKAVHFKRLEDITVSHAGVSDFSVAIDGLKYDCQFRPRTGADTLFIVFNGSVNRQYVQLPVFVRLSPDDLLPGHVLLVSDPMFHLDPDLRGGWFVGTKLHDVAAGMASVIETVAEKIGIASGKVVCYGSAAGGFPAIAVSCHMKQGRFIVLNPHTEILQQRKPHIRQFNQNFDSSQTPEKNAADFPARWSAIKAVQQALKRGADIRGAIAQNTGDVRYVARHYLPFCNAIAVPSGGGYTEDGRFGSSLYSDQDGAGFQPASSEAISLALERHLTNLLSSELIPGGDSRDELPQGFGPANAVLPDTNMRHGRVFRGTTFDSLEALKIERGKVQDFSVTIDGFHYDCRFNERQPGDVLYVMFNGAVNQAEYDLPAFARWNWHGFFQAPILSIFDPTIYLDKNLPVGWFIGNREHDTTTMTARLIEAVAKQIGIAPGRVICYGSSAGGYTAITVASHMSHGRFVAFNAQTDILQFHDSHIQRLNGVFDSSKTPEQNASDFPARWSAIKAVQEAYARDADVRGVLMQNVVDKHHHKWHYIPFCLAFGLPQESGSTPDDRLYSGTFSDPSGHGPEPAAVARMVLQDLVPKLLQTNQHASSFESNSAPILEEAHVDDENTDFQVSVEFIPEKPVHFKNLESLEIETGKVFDFSVQVDDLQFDCRFNDTHPGDILFVRFNGVLTRSDAELPIFSRWNWSKTLQGPILSIFDPTIYLHSDLRAGWYLGTKSNDVAAATAKLIRNFANKIGLELNKVICYGGGAGAFAAMTVASRMNTGRFIAFNPQSNITLFTKQQADMIADVFDPGVPIQQSASIYPERWSATSALRAAIERGTDLRGLIVQNEVDTPYVRKHYKPLCEGLGIEPESGASADGRFFSAYYTDSKGGSQEEAHILRSILNKYLPKLIANTDIKANKSALMEPIRFERIKDINIERNNISDFSVRISGLRYDCRYNGRAQGDMLYVIFNGAVDREAYDVPIFSRWNWHAILNAPILAVFDPILHLDPSLQVAWYVGKKSVDVADGMARMIDTFARKIGIKTNRIVCYGSSGGGFGAMAVASRLKQGRFIAINPQTNILQYYDEHIKEFNNIFDGSCQPVENAAAYPERWSAINAVRKAYQQDANLRGIIIQNTSDEYHHELHYTPFCTAFNLPVEGGASKDGRLLACEFSDPNGHGPEPTTVARAIVEEFVPMLLSSKKMKAIVIKSANDKDEDGTAIKPILLDENNATQLSHQTSSLITQAVHFKRLNELEIERGKIFDFSVKIDGMHYNCRLNDTHENNMLFVTFTDSVIFSENASSIFEGWDTTHFNVPTLAIADPLVTLASGLRTGWYAGTPKHDAPKAIARLIETVAEKMGIKPGRIICSGKSAGGFGAITVASRMKHGRFMAVNADTNILRHSFTNIRKFNRIFDNARKPADNARAFPERWSAIHAARSAFDNGADLRGIIMQNTDDESHFEEHYKPFCKAFGLPVEACTDLNSQFITAVFSDVKGHDPEPASLARKVLDEYIPRLLLK
jgi:predicted Rossmann-fold nucleotide-binding protein